MLNNTAIKRLKPKDKRYKTLDGDNLYLEVMPSGNKYWIHRKTNPNGGRTFKTLGKYPDLSIEDARRERDSGKKKSIPGVATFKTAAEGWYKGQKYKSEKNKKQVWNMINDYLISNIGGMIMSEIKPAHILPILKEIEGRGRLEQCNRIRGKASQIFRYGIANLMCEYDPAALLNGATEKPTVKHHPGITDEDKFKILLRTIDNADHLNPKVKLGLQLSPYVFLRSSELRKSTVGMLDFKKELWLVPAAYMKKKRDHIVPLHPTVIEMLKKAMEYSSGKREDLILPGLREGRPLSENTLNTALRSIGYNGDTHVHHGFRTSFSTLAREIHRFQDDLIERQLAHVEGDKTKKAYDRSYRLEERVTMMMKWGDYLDQLRFED